MLFQKRSEHSVDVLLIIFDTLTLSDYYLTKYILETAADLPTTDLPDCIPNFVYRPETVSLNADNVHSIFLPSADVLTWYPDDDDSGYPNQECHIKRVRVNTL